MLSMTWRGGVNKQDGFPFNAMPIDDAVASALEMIDASISDQVLYWTNSQYL